MSSQDQLQIISAGGDVIFYALDPDKGLTNIGRDPENDIVLEDPGVADFQAILYHRHKPYRLVILDPSGQVILAGELQLIDDSIELGSRAQLQLGNHTLVLVDQPGGGPAGGQPVQSRTGPLPATPAPIPPPYYRPEPPLSRTSFASAPPQPEMTVLSERDAAGYFTSLPPDRVDEVIVIELADYEWTAEVGQPAVYELTLTNGGDRVAMFQIQVQGLDPRWVEISPPQLNLNEHHTGMVSLTITAANVPTSYAGSYYFAVVVTSPTNYPHHSSQLGATFIVKPFYGFIVSELLPRTQTISWFRKSSQTTLTVTNLGNSPANYQLEGRDDERACSYEFEVPGEAVTLSGQAPLHLPPQPWPTGAPDDGRLPAHKAEVPVTIRPHRRPLFLRRRTHRFTVAVAPLEGQQLAKALPGELNQRPLLGLLTSTLLALLLFSWCGLGTWWLFGPHVEQFTVNEQEQTASITSGEKVMLGWSASRFADLRIEPEIGRLEDSEGETEVAPLENTTYTLRSSNLLSDLFPFLTEEVQRRVVVRAVEPAILELSAEPTQILIGEEVILSWQVAHAEDLFLSGGGGLPEPIPTAEYETGQRLMAPSQDTVYSLEAKNFHGDTSKNVAVKVVTPTGTPVPPPEVQFFNVNPNQIVQGESVTLNWSVAGAESVVINPIPGSLPASGSISQSPQQNTAYVLEARKPGVAPVVSAPQQVVVVIPTGTPSPTATPAAPEIIDFNASKTTLMIEGDDKDDNVTLFWSVQGETTDVQLANSQNVIIQTQLTPQAQLEVPVDQDTTLFTLIAYNGDKSNRKSVTFNLETPVPPEPTDEPLAEITEFKIIDQDEVEKKREEDRKIVYEVEKNAKVTFQWRTDENAIGVIFEGPPGEGAKTGDAPVGQESNREIKAGTYSVRALNADNKQGNPRIIDVILKDQDPPKPPENVTVTLVNGKNEVKWVWERDAKLSDSSGFNIYRADAPPGDNFSVVDRIRDNTVQKWTDEELETSETCGKVYLVKVVYEDINGETQEVGDSSTSSAFTPPCPP